MTSPLIPQELQEMLSGLSPEQWVMLDAFRRGAERSAFAIRLLNEKLDRSTIRDRIMQRFGLSRRQAYRVIEGALNDRRTVPCDGTPVLYRER